MTRTSGWLLVFITLLALGLRLYRLDAQSLWLDEASSWRGAQASWPTFIETVVAGEANPPLYFALLKIWTSVFGDSTWAMRLMSVVLGTLTVPLLGRFVTRLAGPGAGCLSALLLAVSPFHIEYSQDARHYALLPLLILAATAALVRALEGRDVGRRRKDEKMPADSSFLRPPSSFGWWALYVFLALLACYTHYFTAFFLAGHGVFIGLLCWQERSLRPGWIWALSMTAVGIGFLPWLPFMLRTNMQTVAWLQNYVCTWTPLMHLWMTGRTLMFGDAYPPPFGDSKLGNAIPVVILALTPLAAWLGYRARKG